MATAGDEEPPKFAFEDIKRRYTGSYYIDRESPDGLLTLDLSLLYDRCVLQHLLLLLVEKEVNPSDCFRAVRDEAPKDPATYEYRVQKGTGFVTKKVVIKDILSQLDIKLPSSKERKFFQVPTTGRLRCRFVTAAAAKDI